MVSWIFYNVNQASKDSFVTGILQSLADICGVREGDDGIPAGTATTRPLLHNPHWPDHTSALFVLSWQLLLQCVLCWSVWQISHHNGTQFVKFCVWQMISKPFAKATSAWWRRLAGTSRSTWAWTRAGAGARSGAWPWPMAVRAGVRSWPPASVFLLLQQRSGARGPRACPVSLSISCLQWLAAAVVDKAATWITFITGVVVRLVWPRSGILPAAVIISVGATATAANTNKITSLVPCSKYTVDNLFTYLG